MANRTKQTTVHFKSGFEMPGLDRPQPAGEYRVDYDEVQMEGASRQAWRRVGTFIYLPAISIKGARRQMVPITSSDLDAALTRDRE